MFRIYLHSTRRHEWLSLEGTLTGQGVDDLERCWLALEFPRRNEPLLLDISGLQSADQNGRRLLKRMSNRGVIIGMLPATRRSGWLGFTARSAHL